MSAVALRLARFLVIGSLCVLSCPLVQAQQLAPAPEAATGRVVKQSGTSLRHMAAAANPLAAHAGREILRAGGSATDAAIAIQLVLNLVEPQSSGIGGGAFFIHYEGKSRRLTSFDGRETAPMAAKPDRFIGQDGKPLGFMAAVVGGRSVGVPGTMRLLEMAHKAHGKLPWAALFAPAIQLAEDGFAISPRLNGLLSGEKALLNDPVARDYFFAADGTPKAVGSLLRNPAFAATLRTLASKGADGFYSGTIADDIVATVTGHPGNPGDMTLADLATYKAEQRDPVCGKYRSYSICGMGPPSSGGIAVQQILGILESRDLRRMGPGAESVHWMAEAGRLAFADRALYVGDPAFLSVPTHGLMDTDYIRSRAGLINPDRAMGTAKAGIPPMKQGFRYAPSDGVEFGTSHISVIDSDGNAVAMTTTIESGFGARIMTKSGFLLNNELTDFSFLPEEDGKPVANRVEPGKRPRSSMAPTLVFDHFGRLYAVVGSPGGSQIIGYVAKTLVALLDWKLDPQQAVDLANAGNRNGPTELERGTEAEAWKVTLEAKGHQVRMVDMTSGIQAIVVTPEGFVGGADGRREGVAIGD